MVSIFTGVFLSLIPILLLFSNGVFIGLISSIIAQSEGIFTFWKLIPHGIFEIPAVIIAIALGIRFGTFVFYDKPLDKFVYYFKNCFWNFVLIILPLLIVAALIEAGLIVLFR